MSAIAVGIVLGLLALAAIAFGVLWLLGMGSGVLWWFTALFHALKPEGVPGKNDSNWSRDQGKEAK